MNKSQILFDEKSIEAAINKIQLDIENNEAWSTMADVDAKYPPIFICVLNGAFMFFTDLVKGLDWEMEIDFIRAKSYLEKNRGDIQLINDININIKGRRVYLIDDIYDSGNTINFLSLHLFKKGAISVIPVTLFKKSVVSPNNLIYGLELENEYFIQGYGLDGKNGLKRNQPYITGFSDDLN